MTLDYHTYSMLAGARSGNTIVVESAIQSSWRGGDRLSLTLINANTLSGTATYCDNWGICLYDVGDPVVLTRVFDR